MTLPAADSPRAKRHPQPSAEWGRRGQGLQPARRRARARPL